MAEFIYTMKKVRKAHGDKVILDVEPDKVRGRRSLFVLPDGVPQPPVLMPATRGPRIDSMSS